MVSIEDNDKEDSVSDNETEFMDTQSSLDGNFFYSSFFRFF